MKLLDIFLKKFIDKKFVIEASGRAMLYSGVSGVKYAIIDGQLVRVVNKEDMGKWVVYKNGKVIDTIRGDQMPKYRDTSENSKREYSPEEINFWKNILNKFQEMYYNHLKSE